MRPRLRIWSPFLLPNMLTSLNLIAGYYAIINVLNRHYNEAAWAILIAAILDGMDGMAARLTRGTSAFGLEFDSMADLVSFGIAPSLFIYLWVLKPYGRVGWVASFLFMACGVLRLARFNVQSHDVQKYRFLGIPIPAAAAQIVTTYLIISHWRIPSGTAGVAVAISTYLAAFLMISNIPYRSLKSISIKRRHSFYVPVLFILITAIIWIYPHTILWILSTVYILSGPVELLSRRVIFSRRTPGTEQTHGLPAARGKNMGNNHG